MIPVALLLSVLVAILGVLWIRYHGQRLQHQERMLAMEKGVAVIPPGSANPWSPRVYLLRGLIWSISGAALTIALLGVSLSDRPRQMSALAMAEETRHVSQRLDISIDQAREIVTKDEAERVAHPHSMPAAIALFGLIPLGVGLAYLIFYFTDESRKHLPADAPYGSPTTQS